MLQYIFIFIFIVFSLLEPADSLLMPSKCNVAACKVNPCQVNRCPAYPDATCVPDYCGGCFAKFYSNGHLVTCDSELPPILPAHPPELVCPRDWYGAFIICTKPIQNQCDSCERQGKLCCPHGCSMVCKTPEPPKRRDLFLAPQSLETTKAPLPTLPTPSSRCPPMPQGSIGMCVHACSNCEQNGQICCSNGCGYACMDPLF